MHLGNGVVHIANGHLVIGTLKPDLSWLLATTLLLCASVDFKATEATKPGSPMAYETTSREAQPRQSYCLSSSWLAIHHVPIALMST